MLVCRWNLLVVVLWVSFWLIVRVVLLRCWLSVVLIYSDNVICLCCLKFVVICGSVDVRVVVLLLLVLVFSCMVVVM